MKRLCILLFLVAGLAGLSSSLSGYSQAGTTAFAYLHLKVGGVGGGVSAFPPGTQTSLDREGNCPEGICVLAYPVNTEVTLTPTAFGGSFLGWDGLPGKLWRPSCASMTVCTMNIYATHGLKALFNPVELNVSSTTGGWVEVLTPGSPCGNGCYRYNVGDLVRVRAHNDEGHSFSSWYGGCEGIGAGCRFTIRDNRSMSAIFRCHLSACKVQQPVTKLVRASIDVRGPGGVVFGRGKWCASNRCPVDVAKRSLLSVEAKPNSGASVTWSGVSCAPGSLRCSFPVYTDSTGRGPTVYVSFR